MKRRKGHITGGIVGLLFVILHRCLNISGIRFGKFLSLELYILMFIIFAISFQIGGDVREGIFLSLSIRVKFSSYVCSL